MRYASLVSLTDDELMAVAQALLEEMPKKAGPNAPQVEWFFHRLEAWSAREWSVFALKLAKPGLVANALNAFEASGAALLEPSTNSPSTPASFAWNAGDFFCKLHRETMVEGVANAVRILAAAAPQSPTTPTQDEWAEQIDAGLGAVRHIVQVAAVALAARPMLPAALFHPMWAPMESSLQLLAAEAGRS